MAEAPLAELCSLVTDGTHDTPRVVVEGFPLVKAKEIVGGRIDFTSCDSISLNDHMKVIARSKPELGDTLFAHIGASLGEAAYVGTAREFSIKNIALFKPNPEVVIGRYLYYLIVGPGFQGTAKAARTGSAQPFLSLGQLRKHPVRHHRNLRAQAKIATILSAYDDLIENNNRRIKLLEEMAQRIYREWFVDFRYPGHEDVPLGDSELGPIPEGWSVAPVGSVTQVLGGGTPSKKVVEYWEPGTITWFTPTDLTSAAAMFMSESRMSISERGLAKSSARLFPAGSVMMTSRATIGVVSLSTGPAATNQGFLTCLVGDLVGTYHLYFWLIDQREVVASLASGATFKEINKATFRNIPFLAGVRKVEHLFEDRIEPIGGEILNLLRAQRTLRATRDLLLPRLISGQIDVTELDIAMAEAAA